MYLIDTVFCILEKISSLVAEKAFCILYLQDTFLDLYLCILYVSCTSLPMTSLSSALLVFGSGLAEIWKESRPKIFFYLPTPTPSLRINT